MRLKPRLPLILLPIALWLCFASCAEAADSARDGILNTFREYEALNADFLSSVGHDNGKSGKPYAVLRKEVEAYAEGPFETALGAAHAQVCKFKDTEVINALFRVILATSNSASESPSWSLGKMFVCQPVLVEQSFRGLPLEKQQALFPTLEFGFENAVYGKPKDNKRVLELRQKLQSLVLGRKQ